MSFDPNAPLQADPIDRTRRVRDTAAVVCISLGVVGLVVAAFLFAPLLGLAAASAAVAGTGVALGSA